MTCVHVTAKGDYAVRAMLELAAAADDRLVTGEHLAEAQELPRKFLEAILADLRRAGLVQSQRGVDGGYRLARPAWSITIADVLRAVEGPLTGVKGSRPESTEYGGAAESLQAVWIAVRASIRSVLEAVTLEQVVSGELPDVITRYTEQPDAWTTRA
jgi:Rrf2 family protein